MGDGKFYEQGLRFKCQRCSFCCGHGPGFVYLSRKDLQVLLDYFKIGVGEFVEKYCRWADYYEGKTVLALFEKKNYDCVLWDNGCSAYQARPVQCRTYPFWSWMVSDRKTWDECAEDCPGMNQGDLWDKDFIDASGREYDGNVPLTKEEVLVLIEEENACEKDGASADSGVALDDDGVALDDSGADDVSADCAAR